MFGLAAFRKRRALEPVSHFTTSPSELAYQRSTSVVVSVPVSHCRMNLMTRPALENPFVATLRGGQRHYENSALADYFKANQPVTVGDLLGISDSPIAADPAMAAVMPWWGMTPEERLQQVAVETPQGFLGKEAIKLGAHWGKDYGWQYFGPVSDGVAQQEFKRQWAVYHSIRNKGYKPDSYKHIHGEFLIAEQDWVWVNLGGKHRFNALVASGEEQVVVSSRGKYGAHFVYRSDANIWPNVMNGNYTLEEALQVFDRILAG